jgi:hypothetical protein
MTVSTTGDAADDVSAARKAREAASASDELIGSRRLSPSHWLRKGLLRIVLRGQRGDIGWHTDGEGKRWYYAPGGPHDPHVRENYDWDEEGDAGLRPRTSWETADLDSLLTLFKDADDNLSHAQDEDVFEVLYAERDRIAVTMGKTLVALSE